MAELPAKVGGDQARALALVTAYFNAPDGAKLDDETFAGLLDEALADPRATMVGLLLLTHRLLNEAGEDADVLLARAGLALDLERTSEAGHDG